MTEPSNSTDILPPLAGRLMQGTIWMVAMRWGVRVLGIISMFVLVRLLESEDFGLIAMAMAIVALVDQFTDFGIVWALVRDKRAGQAEFDTAWTVRQGQLGFVALIALVAAPLAATFYEDPRVTGVLQVVALAFVIRGFENIGVIEFQRRLQFQLEFVFRVLAKFIGVAITIGLAVWLRNYWALAWGMLATNLASVILSYWISPYRPRWSVAAWQKLWAFSQWILTQGFAKYIYLNMPVLFLGRLTTAESVGYYSVSSEIASLPATEIAMPVSRAVLPGFSKIVDDHPRLKAGYLKALGAVATVTLPLGLGIASVAEETVRLIFGTHWLPAVTLLQIFSIFAAFKALDSLTGNLLIVIDRVRSFAAITWIQALLLIVGIAPAFAMASLEGVALLRAAASFTGLLLLIGVVVNHRVAKWRDVGAVLIRPLAAASIMYLAVSVVSFFANDLSTISSFELAFWLMIKISTGGAIYLMLVWLLWQRAGRPDGLEAMAWERLIIVIKTLFRR